MRLIIKDNYEECSKWVAEYIVYKINKSQRINKNKPFVLGLPTGSTPLGTYKNLISMYKDGLVSFKNVITFNMDEYVNLPEDNEQSYHYFMWNNFFKFIDIQKENVNILNGMTKDIKTECENYEEKIKSCGGIDLFFGGVGTDGHIAFNEPYSSLTSRTRLKMLNSSTIKDNSRFFDNDINKTPKTALTVGIGTIMDAKEVLIMANGLAKAKAIYDAVEGPITQASTISALQLHKDAIIVCDEDATNELKVKTVKYFKDMENHTL